MSGSSDPWRSPSSCTASHPLPSISCRFPNRRVTTTPSCPYRQDLEAELARIEAHIEEAQTQLAEAKEALLASVVPPGAEGREALDQRIALLQARIQVGRRHQKLFDEAKSVREEKEQLQGDSPPGPASRTRRPTHSTVSRRSLGS